MGDAYDPEDLRLALAERRLVELDGTIRPSEDLALYRAEMAAGRARAAPGLGGGAARVGRGQRRLPPGHPGAPRRGRPADLAGPARHLRRAVAVERLERPPQRAADARHDGGARRGGRRRAARARPALGPRGPGLPARRRRAPRGRRAPAARTAARGARHRPFSGRGRGRRTRGRRRRYGCLAGRPDAARRRLRGPHGAAVTPGPAGLRPQAHGRAVPSSTTSWRCTSRRATRRWGYWALPVLHGDRLVGKVDATADRTAGVLRRRRRARGRSPSPRRWRPRCRRELEGLARWLGLVLRRRGG